MDKSFCLSHPKWANQISSPLVSFLATLVLSSLTKLSSRQEPLVSICAFTSIREWFKVLIKLPTFQHPRCSRHLFYRLTAASCFRQQQNPGLSWQNLSTQRTLTAHVTFWPHGKCIRWNIFVDVSDLNYQPSSCLAWSALMSFEYLMCNIYIFWHKMKYMYFGYWLWKWTESVWRENVL